MIESASTFIRTVFRVRFIMKEFFLTKFTIFHGEMIAQINNESYPRYSRISYHFVGADKMI
jgi:hypothetical protein